MKITVLPLGEVRANTYIITDEASGETALIDCGLLNSTLTEVLAGVGQVKYILLTHGHFDHIYGVPELKDLTGAPVLIHKNDADCLWDEQRSLAYRHIPGMQRPMEPDGFLAHGDVLRLGEQELRVIHTPGHSKGSVCFLCGDKLFTGDTLFCKMVGRTDFPDGDEGELLASVKGLFDLPGDYIVYPGHNRATTLGEERKTNRVLRHRDVFGY